MDITELYRIVYHGPKDHLRGAILVCDTETGFQFLFKDKSLDTFGPKDLFLHFFNVENQVEADTKSNPMSQPFIKSGDHITLSGPSEASIGFLPDFALSYFLFGDIRHSLVVEKPDHSKHFSVPLQRNFMTHDGTRTLSILYACFEKAVEAHVKVKMANVMSAFDLCGVIAARTSAIEESAYSSILFFKGEDEKFQVKPGNGDDELPLSRSIVGVPFGSKLILQFGLRSDGSDIIHYEQIDVTEDETSSKSIRQIHRGNQCVMQAEINWRSKREFESY